MSKEWAAAFFISADQAKKYIQQSIINFPEIESIYYFAKGWDNIAFIVNNSIVFRFPRRQEGVNCIKAENAVLPNLKTRFNLLIPRIDWVGEIEKDKFIVPFHGYKKIEGKTGDRLRFGECENEHNLIILSVFLKQLHEIKEEEAQVLGAEEQAHDKTNTSSMIDDLQKRIDVILQKGIVSFDLGLLKKEFQVVKSIKLSKQGKVLVHGDLGLRHLIFDEQKIVGVIDWGDVGINHSVVDLAIIHEAFSVKWHQIFFKHYREVEKDVWRYARFIAIYKLLTLMLYSHDIDDFFALDLYKKRFLQIYNNLF